MLLVDDERVIRAYLKDVLKAKGIRTIEAENAAQAFKIIRELDGKVDCVISDILMPGDMSGLDLAYAIRNSFPAVPVILISGFCEKEEEEEIIKSGFPFLRKPFTAAAILRAVRPYLTD